MSREVEVINSLHLWRKQLAELAYFGWRSRKTSFLTLRAIKTGHTITVQATCRKKKKDIFPQIYVQPFWRC
jgi:hypothetical protein